MTPEEKAAADAAAAAQAAFDYSKLDYSKLDYSKIDPAKIDLAKLDLGKLAALVSGEQQKKDADAAALKAADDKRKADEAAAAAGGKQKPWNVKESPEFIKLQADLDAKVAKDAEREKKAELKERSGTVKSALSEYVFATENAKNSAFKLLLDEIKLGEDGETYFGPDGTTPADVYIAKMMDTEFDYFLKPKDVGGSGARNGGSRKETAFDIESIRPGMKPEERARAYAEIARINGRS